jgi:serine/threonine protein kinase
VGVIHRDLKPNNLMIDEEGHVKLIDFNLCKTGIVTSLQRTNSFCGTPAYMPPEIMGSQSYGKSADWYLLGVVMYEMLIGVPPYFDRDPEKIQKAIMKGDLKFPIDLSVECKDLL